MPSTVPADPPRIRRVDDTRYPVRMAGLLGHGLVPPSENDGFAIILKREECQLIADAISRLNDGDRRIINLHFFEGWSFEEIGHTLGITKAAVHQRIPMILFALRRHLAIRGVRRGDT